MVMAHPVETSRAQRIIVLRRRAFQDYVAFFYRVPRKILINLGNIMIYKDNCLACHLQDGFGDSLD